MILSRLPIAIHDDKHSESAIFFDFVKKFHRIHKNIMRENSSFSQHRHFLHDKFLSNDKYLQIYKHWYSQWCKRLFEIILNHKGFSILSHILKKRGEYFPVMIIFLVMIIYVILRTTFGLYSITRSWYDKVIGGYIRGYILFEFKF